MNVLSFTFCLFLFIGRGSGYSHDHDHGHAGECVRSRVVPETVLYSTIETTADSYTTQCGSWWNRKRCRRVVYRSVTECCDGYQDATPDHEHLHCKPICSDCDSNHLCTAPETCVCHTGWTGDNCNEDINECQVRNGDCDHHCFNSAGSHICTCDEGFGIGTDTRSCLGPPNSVNADPIDSTSILLNWTHPIFDSQNSSIITRYTVWCVSTEGDTVREVAVSSDQFEYQVNSLEPYSNYKCCVNALTTIGNSSSSCASAQTMEDTPEDPPQNITVNNDSDSELLVSWTPPLTPNGIITQYTVYANGTEACAIDGFNNSCEIIGLSVYQLVYVQVSASTSAGEGPLSEAVAVQTHQAVPSAVTSLKVTAPFPNLIEISWEPPKQRNGIITGYTVTVFNLEQGYSNTTFVDANIMQWNISQGIRPEVPFTVQVQAYTEIGGGDIHETVVFTLEGLPTKSPEITEVYRRDATTAVLSFVPLSLDELRGFPTSYVVEYAEIEIHKCTRVDTEEKPLLVQGNRAVITDLDPLKEYCVHIAASTAVGIGNFTNGTDHIGLFDNTLFQLHFGEVKHCRDWTEQDAEEKINDFTTALRLELSKLCDCYFHSEHIGDVRLLCNSNTPGIVILQGRIICTNERNASQLINDVERIALAQTRMEIQYTQLTAMDNCSVRLSELGQEPECVRMESNEFKSSKPSKGIGLKVGLPVGSLLVVIVLAGVSIFICRGKKTWKRCRQGDDEHVPEHLRDNLVVENRNRGRQGDDEHVQEQPHLVGAGNQLNGGAGNQLNGRVGNHGGDGGAFGDSWPPGGF